MTPARSLLLSVLLLLAACKEEPAISLSDAERRQLASPGIEINAMLEQAVPAISALLQTTEASMNSSGRPLDKAEIEYARDLGVKLPEFVRISVREQFPQLNDPRLERAAKERGLDFGTDKELARTQGYAILLKPSVASSREQLAIELVRVGQFERAGSIEVLTRRYLTELMVVGPGRAPLDQEAAIRIKEAAQPYRVLNPQ